MKAMNVFFCLMLLGTYALADLTLAQKTLVYTEDLHGKVIGGGSNPTQNTPATMNQCIISVRYGDFLASSGAGFGGYCCSIGKELAALKGYQLADLPKAVYGKYLKCVIGYPVRGSGCEAVDFEISESTEDVTSRSMISDGKLYVCEP